MLFRSVDHTVSDFRRAPKRRPCRRRSSSKPVEGSWGLIGPPWGSLGLPGAPWGSPELPGAFWGSLGLCGALWGSLGPSRALWGSVGPSGALWGSLGLSGALWGCLGPSGAPWGSVGLCGALWGSWRQALQNRAPRPHGSAKAGFGRNLPPCYGAERWLRHQKRCHEGKSSPMLWRKRQKKIFFCRFWARF